jgi:dihydroorotate dehydrogenase (fumarate)
MANLETSYMGINLSNPVIAGASALTENVDTIKKLEDAGAAAVVTASLFEEEIQLERYKLEEDLSKFDNKHPEMADVFPDLEHAGPDEHLMWVRKAKEAVDIPVIGSLNALNIDVWLDWAKKMEQTGIDALELNLYRFPSKPENDAASIEKEQISQLRTVADSISIPVAVKVSPFYTNPISFIQQADQEGIKGFVLFNRFFQPDIDIEKEQNTFPFNLSNRVDNKLPLRYAGLLYGMLKGDICASTGIFEGEDVIKMLLAGASCVQVVSTLFRNKVSHVTTMIKAIQDWMEKKGYTNIDDFRGSLSQKNSKEPRVYERAQYVKLLLNPQVIVNNYPVL